MNGPWRLPGRLLVVLLELVTGSALPASAADDERVVLELVVNEFRRGETEAVLRAGDVLVSVADLERAGLRRLDGQRETIDRRPYVSLRSLGPAIRFEVDERALALRLHADPVLFDVTVVDLRPGPPPGLTYLQAPAGFLNYAVSVQDVSRYSAFGELGLSAANALLFSSAARLADGSLVRGLSSLTVDDRPTLTRWTLGDRLVTLDELGGSLVLGGVSASREFGLDPYAIRYPALGLSGGAEAPSTADVYVNGVLVRREALPPGPFRIENLPAPTGPGTVRVVVRDPFGREREIVSPFYFTSALLAPGLHDYSYSVGLPRRHLDTSGPGDYSSTPAFLSRHRVGFTSWLTAGLRLEASPTLVSGGPLLSARLPLGEVALSAAGSRQDNRAGWATLAAYTLIGRPLSLGAAVRVLSSHYATTSLDVADDRARLETSAFVGLELGPRASLTLAHARATFRDRGRRERVTAFAGIRVTDRMSLLVSGTYHLATPTPPAGTPREAETEVFAAVTYYFGDRTTGSLSHQQRGSERASTAEVQRSLPVGTGFGYRLRGATTGDQEAAGGVVQYQGPYGRYEVAGEVVNGQGSTTLSAAGGLVAVGGGLYPTRPVQDSFALIRVPDVAGVRGYADNQEIGRTNARGDLLVPNLQPYFGNRLRIADTDIPLDRFVEGTEQLVATPYRGGALVRFPVGRLQAFTGRVLIEVAGRTTIPETGELRVAVGRREVESPIGRDGEFYLENIPAGPYPATIEHGGRRCAFTLHIPEATQTITDLGVLTCRLAASGAP